MHHYVVIQSDNKMNQGNFNQNTKDNQNIQPQSREGVPAYYANPIASNFQNGQQFPLQYGQQYQLQSIQRQYPNPPIAPYAHQPFQNYNENYTIHWGKVIGFLISFGIIMYLNVSSKISCIQNSQNSCQDKIITIVIYALFGSVYLLINAIICKVKIQNLSPLCLFLVSHQQAHQCQCWLGVLAGSLILIYFPIAFLCFIYFMIKHFCREQRGQTHMPGASANEIVANNNI